MHVCEAAIEAVTAAVANVVAGVSMMAKAQYFEQLCSEFKP